MRAFPKQFPKTPKPRIKTILQVVSALTWVTTAEMEGKSTGRVETFARHLAIWLVKFYRPELTLNQIALFFGMRSHTTIRHAHKSVKKNWSFYHDAVLAAQALCETATRESAQ